MTKAYRELTGSTTIFRYLLRLLKKIARFFASSVIPFATKMCVLIVGRVILAWVEGVDFTKGYHHSRRQKCNIENNYKLL